MEKLKNGKKTRSHASKNFNMKEKLRRKYKYYTNLKPLHSFSVTYGTSTLSLN